MNNKHNRAHSQMVGTTPNSVKSNPRGIKDGTITPSENYGGVADRQILASHIPAPSYDAQYLKRLLFIKAAID